MQDLYTSHGSHGAIGYHGTSDKLQLCYTCPEPASRSFRVTHIEIAQVILFNP